MNTPTDTQAALAWITGDDTGTSSQTIWAVMMDAPAPKWASVPLDPSDFGRCHRLLQLIPSWRARLSEVAARHPKWGPMVARWDEVAAIYEQELAENTGKAPRTYALMKTIWRDCMTADGYRENAPGSWIKASDV